jgi:hypothetical protein
MRISNIALAVVLSTVVIAAGLTARVLGTTQPGPLLVTDSADLYAIKGVSTNPTLGNGVVGTSSTGIGVLGQTANASHPGVVGQNSKGGTGVSGTSTTGIGVSGTSDGIGIKGSSTKSYVGVEGTAGVNGVGILGTASYAVEGDSTGDSIGAVGVLGQNAGQYGTALSATTEQGSLAITAYSYTAGGYVMSLDASGNMVLKGALTQNGSPSLVIRHARGGARTAYGSESASPAIEDTGEAQTSAGAAFVPLDPAFAATLDPRTRYAVLLTPEGDCRGLYVAARTARGFWVRELMSGRSTIAFAYRIVGRPAGSDTARLPLFNDSLTRMPKPMRSRETKAL